MSNTDPYLTVVATNGDEPVNTRVLVDRSVSGRLIREDCELIAIDPRQDALYRSYLGRDMRSELALKWILTPSTSLIINLEAPTENAFKEVHINALKRARRYLQPILAGLYSRRDRSLLQQRALLYSLDNHLSIVTAIFKHDLLTPLSRVRVIADKFDILKAELPMPAREYADSLREAVAGIEGVRTALAQDVVGFSHNEARSVCDLLKAARQLSRPDELAKRNIDVKIVCDTDAYVYCSLFLKEIFVNLFSNAKYWLEQRMLDDPRHNGMILVQVATDTPSTEDDRREAELNQKVVVTVRDNGPGMSEADLSRVFERNFTLREGGTGFGLFAAKEYVNSLGGTLVVNSVPDEFFQVTITLDVYDSRLHPEAEAPTVLEINADQ